MQNKDPAKLKIVLGTSNVYAFARSFFLNSRNRQTHKRIHGISGQGKSKLLAHYTATLIQSGLGCLLLDPHQDLCDDVLCLLTDWGYFQKEGYSKLLYIDFSRRDRFLPFNFLNQPFDMYTIARNMVEVCTRVWPTLSDGGGPLFEEIMLASVAVLVACSLPLTALPDLLTDKEYRNTCLATPGVSHQAIRFFQKEFDHWRDQAQMIGSTMRRVFTLTFGPTLTYTLGQSDNLLNFTTLMEQNISLIVNLHGLDEETQKLLGCLIMVGVEQATIARTENRTEYHVVVDEFASFSTRNGEAYEKLLSQARKFKVFLTVAHQTNSQLQESMLKAVGNMTTEVHFRLSHDDSLYEAPRLFEHNPYQKKDEVKDQEAKETHLPLYKTPQEILNENAKLLRDLHPRQAFVKTNQHKPRLLAKFFPVSKTVKIKTLEVLIKEASKQHLPEIKEYYALNYMKSEADLANHWLVTSPPSNDEDKPPPSWSP